MSRYSGFLKPRVKTFQLFKIPKTARLWYLKPKWQISNISHHKHLLNILGYLWATRQKNNVSADLRVCWVSELREYAFSGYSRITPQVWQLRSCENLERAWYFSSYDEVLRFWESAAKYVCEISEHYHRVLGLGRHIGPIFSRCNNFDLIVFFPSGHCSAYTMGIKCTQCSDGFIHPGTTTPTSVMSMKIPRLRKKWSSQTPSHS